MGLKMGLVWSFYGANRGLYGLIWGLQYMGLMWLFYVGFAGRMGQRARACPKESLPPPKAALLPHGGQRLLPQCQRNRARNPKDEFKVQQNPEP